MTRDTTQRVGRPPVGPRIALRIPQDLVDRIDKHAEEIGSTRSAVLREGAEAILRQCWACATKE